MFQTTSNRRPWLRWFVDNENPARVCGIQKGGRAGSRENPHQGLGRISIRANTLGAVNAPDGTSGNCQRPAPQSSSASRFTAEQAGFFILNLEPIGGAPRTVGRILALRDDAFEAKLAGVGEDGRAVTSQMLIEPDAGAGLGHDRGERGVANLKRIAP